MNTIKTLLVFAVISLSISFAAVQSATAGTVRTSVDAGIGNQDGTQRTTVTSKIFIAYGGELHKCGSCENDEKVRR